MSEWGVEHTADDPRLCAYEHVRAAVFVTDGPAHRIVTANAAARLLLGDDVVGRELGDVVPGVTGSELDCWTQTRTHGVAGNLRLDLPARGDRAGAALTPYDVALDPWRDRAGAGRGVVAQLSTATAVAGADPHRARSRGRRSELTAEMQEALVPDQLPVLPRVDVAATYLLADSADSAGGDWFDVVLTPAGDLALVVGDVVGRGPDGVAAMAHVRAVLRERLRTGSTVEEALAATDGAARELPAAAATTVCVAVLEQEDGALTYCTAGHPAPLVVDPEGGARQLPPSGGGALATRSARLPVAEARIDPGELLLLYTDGAVRGRPDAADHPSSLARLAGAVFAAVGGGHGIRGTVDAVCERLLSQGSAGNGDDVVLLAAERMAAPPSLTLSLPAERETVRAVRAAFGDWLHDLGARDLDAMAVLHAVGEVTSNAVEHAYADVTAPGPDAVTVSAALDGTGHAVISVQDRGRWRPVQPPARGRGLAMARGFADDLRVDRTADGTRVTVRHALGRPVSMFRGKNGTHRSRAREDLRVVGHGGHRVSVHGVVDPLSAESLRTALMRSSRGGTASILVDLTGVSFLCSAGVQVLAEALGWSHGDAGVALAAAHDSPAQQVLETVGLPYRTA